ncbi:adenosylcobinamide amidohydrolase [Paenibacillus sp. LHD-117]|uniref:adenosylcobinamide amidohydrolase n=1 Tax=Paenibacillus sp. LHD-117 TaxID=3071412 RepID=UPI0027DEE37E|nr:adenosylcobinamide amidohydrolase [Paenibacillus sp. LHD-117]MDQ6421604.1 adenosylcobinamide amidohydrolase [Paenibacillus sp. LHD-117]
MTQPFRSGITYSSLVWPGLVFALDEDTLRVRFPEPLHALSSAILPGGFSIADELVNWKVPLDYDGSDPLTELKARCMDWGCDPSRTVGFMTAAKLTHASLAEQEGDRFRLVCCSTVGTRNAARAGYPRETYSAYTPGTINIALFIDGRMTESAMVNAVITATEAKAAALQELGVAERASGLIATGTTTDAVAVCVSQRSAWNDVHAYAGSATSIGCAIGEAVFRTVSEAVRTQGED